MEQGWKHSIEGLRFWVYGIAALPDVNLVAGDSGEIVIFDNWKTQGNFNWLGEKFWFSCLI